MMTRNEHPTGFSMYSGLDHIKAMPRKAEIASGSKGLRIRMARVFLGISREEFCKRHDINFNTLTSIELDRLKLSDKQVQKIIEAFQSEGLAVSPQWLMEGLGDAPSRILDNTVNAGEDFLVRWATRFFSQPRNAVVCIVPNDAMEPFYTKGDLVGGVWHATPEAILGKRCIARINDQLNVGVLLLNRGAYSLAPANPRTYHNIHIVKSSDVFYAGEIMWHVRHEAHKISELRILEMAREPNISTHVSSGI